MTDLTTDGSRPLRISHRPPGHVFVTFEGDETGAYLDLDELRDFLDEPPDYVPPGRCTITDAAGDTLEAYPEGEGTDGLWLVMTDDGRRNLLFIEGDTGRAEARRLAGVLTTWAES